MIALPSYISPLSRLFSSFLNNAVTKKCFGDGEIWSRDICCWVKEVPTKFGAFSLLRKYCGGEVVAWECLQRMYQLNNWSISDLNSGFSESDLHGKVFSGEDILKAKMLKYGDLQAEVFSFYF